MCSNISFQSKVEVFEGHAKFDENGVCHVGDQQIAGDHTLIATGGHPIVPDLPGEIVLCFLCRRLVLVILFSVLTKILMKRYRIAPPGQLS